MSPRDRSGYAAFGCLGLGAVLALVTGEGLWLCGAAPVALLVGVVLDPHPELDD